MVSIGAAITLRQNDCAMNEANEQTNSRSDSVSTVMQWYHIILGRWWHIHSFVLNVRSHFSGADVDFYLDGGCKYNARFCIFDYTLRFF